MFYRVSVVVLKKTSTTRKNKKGKGIANGNMIDATIYHIFSKYYNLAMCIRIEIVV